MCMIINDNVKREVEKQAALNGGKIRAWKVLLQSKRENTWYSLIQPYIWQLGVNVSNRAVPGLLDTDIMTHQVHAGFHVYLCEQTAIGYATEHQNSIVMPVTCDMADFVAAGYHEESCYTHKSEYYPYAAQAVFTKVTLQ